MSGTGSAPPGNQSPFEVPSLQEPVDVTIVTLTQLRDLNKIAFKLKHVLKPKTQEEQGYKLRDWDLWGPLFLCLTLAFTLAVSSPATDNPEESGSVAFALVFVVVWMGAVVITFNAQLLGSSLCPSISSFFQSVCALGYCLFPIDIGAMVGLALGSSIFLIRFVCVGIGCGWSVLAAIGFLEQLVPPKRWRLAAYPVVLFYVFLAWLVMIVCGYLMIQRRRKELELFGPVT